MTDAEYREAIGPALWDAAEVLFRNIEDTLKSISYDVQVKDSVFVFAKSAFESGRRLELNRAETEE